MVKIGIIADVHANYPALQEVMKHLQYEDCDAIYHVGDAITIGPYPRESIECLFDHPKVHMLKGNHEEYLAYGIPTPQPDYMSDGEVAHQHWTHSQLNNLIRDRVREFPYIIKKSWEGVTITLCHCSFQHDDSRYKPFDDLRNRMVKDLDAAFSKFDGELVIYGHTHMFSDMQGKKRYINPGSLGCHKPAYARYTVIEIKKKETYTVKHCIVPYDKKKVLEAMSQRHVPAREFICRVFF